jgi:DtxR family Mn-dependent transcriptional regulator
MYLITIARAGEEGASGPVPIANLAGALGVSVASANEMVRKLAGKDLVDYIPYKGTRLTADGERVAGRVLRTRRLWSTFLAAHLDFSPAEADDLACNLEHVTPPAAAERLAAFLGDPKAGPLGRPIPPDTGMPPRRETRLLSDADVGSVVEVVSAMVPDPAGDFLAAEGIVPGAVITVAGRGDSGVLVDVGGTWVHLAAAIAASVFVMPEAGDAGR